MKKIYLLVLVCLISLSAHYTYAGDLLTNSIAGGAGAALSCSGAIEKITEAITHALTGGAEDAASDSVSTKDKELLKKEKCGDAIAYAVAKTALATLTQKTVNWINGGFEGNPLFVQNPTKYYASIWKQQVTDFNNTLLSDKARYPYGQSFAQNFVSGAKNYFEKNAQYTVGDELARLHPGQDAATAVNNWHNDFSTGGWSTWMAETQQPQNNPVGFYLQAQGELARRTADLNQSVGQKIQNEVSQGRGFLNQKECVSNRAGKKYDAQAEKAAKINLDIAKNAPKPKADTILEPVFDPISGEMFDPNPEPSSGQSVKDAQLAYDKARCDQSSVRTKTPGSVIANQLDKALGSSYDQLNLADEVNESLTQVFDALLGQLVNKGLASLETSTQNDKENIGSYDAGDNSIEIANDSSNDLPWQSYIPRNTNLTTTSTTDTNGIPYLIKTQQDILAQIPLAQNALQNILYHTYIGDYCVPGPSPDWEEKTTAKIHGIANELRAQQKDGKDTVTGKIISYVPAGGTVLSGIYNTVYGWFSSNDSTSIADFNQTLLQGIDEYAVQIHGGTYTRTIKKQTFTFTSSGYTLANLPLAAAQIFQEYNKTPAYQNAISQYTDHITSLRSAINKLQYIHTQAIAISQSSASQTDKDIQVAQLQQLLLNIAPDMGTAQTLQDITTSIVDIQTQDAYVLALVKNCAAQINDPTYRAKLYSDKNGRLDNWRVYPGVTATLSNASQTTFTPLPGITLPLPTLNGPGGTSGTNTFVPWSAMKVTEGVDPKVYSLEDTFGFFEDTLDIH